MSDKILHGGRAYYNPHRIQESDYDTAYNRSYSWCGHFIDIKEMAEYTKEINCPECMKSEEYMMWYTELVKRKLHGLSYKFVENRKLWITNADYDSLIKERQEQWKR